MKKTIFALFLCLFCGVFLCGAGFDSTSYLNKNAFRLSRQTNADGSLSVSYVFPVNSDVVLKNGTEKDLQTYKFYLFSYVLALAKQNESRATDGVKIGNVTYFTDVDGIGFSISFDDITAQKKFFGSSESAETDTKTKTSGFFMTKTEMNIPFPFSKESAESYKQICALAINSWCKAEEKTAAPYMAALEESVFIYDFASPTKNLKSEQMYKGESFYHNIFIKTQAEIEKEPSITFYTSVPNVAAWYGMAVLIVVCGSFVAYKLLKNRQKSS